MKAALTGLLAMIWLTAYAAGDVRPVAPQGPATEALPPVARFAHPQDLNSLASSYPVESRRRGEQGDVTLTFWVDEQGVASRPRISASSGYPRLNVSTLDWLNEHRPLFVPLVVNGVPVAGWQRFTVRWRLH